MFAAGSFAGSYADRSLNADSPFLTHAGWMAALIGLFYLHSDGASNLHKIGNFSSMSNPFRLSKLS